MSNLLVRFLTGTVFVIVILGSIIWNPYSFGALFLLITCWATLEFFNLSEKEGIFPQKLVGVLIAAGIFITNFLYATGLLTEFVFMTAAIPLFFIILIIELFKKTSAPFTNIAFTLLGLIYVALPFSLLSYVGMYPAFNITESYSPELLLGFFFILWANDTGAYLIGSMIGRHKLFERVSPNKSWEGSIGGAVTSLLVAWLTSLYFHHFDLQHWLAMALIIAVTGSLGDLVQSRLKRSINIKDSGNILPGHGGLLDRFDGVLLSAPFVLTYLVLFS